MEYDVEKISNKIRNKRIKHNIFKYIILNILIILFIINLILSFEEDTHILGFYVFNIVSESMVPTFEKNDLVVVRKCAPEDLKKGDIITFNHDGRTISHRIIRITNDNGVLFTTKGDNNEVADVDPVKCDQIYGKFVFKIKKIGNIVSYIQNIRGLVNIVIFVVIVFALVSLKDKHKNERKIKRKKYEIKKIRDNYHL